MELVEKVLLVKVSFKALVPDPLVPVAVEIMGWIVDFRGEKPVVIVVVIGSFVVKETLVIDDEAVLVFGIWVSFPWSKNNNMLEYAKTQSWLWESYL